MQYTREEGKSLASNFCADCRHPYPCLEGTASPAWPRSRVWTLKRRWIAPKRRNPHEASACAGCFLRLQWTRWVHPLLLHPSFKNAPLGHGRTRKVSTNPNIPNLGASHQPGLRCGGKALKQVWTLLQRHAAFGSQPAVAGSGLVGSFLVTIGYLS